MNDLNDILGLVTDGDSMELLENNWFKFIGEVSDKDTVIKKLNKEVVEDDMDMLYYRPLSIIEESDLPEVKTNHFLINSLVKNKIRDNSSRFLKALQSGRKADLRIETNSDLEVSMRNYNSNGGSFCHDVSLYAPYNSPIFFYGKKVVEQKYLGKKSLTRHMTRYERGLRDPYRSEIEMINEGLNQFQDQIEQENEDWNEMMMQDCYEDDFFDSIDYEMMDQDEEWNSSYAKHKERRNYNYGDNHIY